MRKDRSKGKGGKTFELTRPEVLILTTLIRSSRPMCGREIWDALKEIVNGGKEIKKGPLYGHLHVLWEDKGFLSASTIPPENRPGGRRKRVYSLNGPGRLALARAVREYQTVTKEAAASIVDFDSPVPVPAC